MALAGGAAVRVLESVLWFNFTLVGRGAYYIDRADGQTRLRYLDIRSGRTATVAGNLGDVSSGLSVSPDGRPILYSRLDSAADDLMLVPNFR